MRAWAIPFAAAAGSLCFACALETVRLAFPLLPLLTVHPVPPVSSVAHDDVDILLRCEASAGKIAMMAKVLKTGTHDIIALAMSNGTRRSHRSVTYEGPLACSHLLPSLP